MGKAKILTLPTPILRKRIGQFNKLFGLWSNQKKKPLQMEHSPPTNVMREGLPNFLSQTRGLRNTLVTRRQVVLNRHFTEIVSDVLAQSFKMKLDQLGVSITSIETRAWNKGLCVFYTVDDYHDIERIRLELNKLIPDLLAAITERRLIGRTPSLTFAFDRTTLLDKQLSEALAKVDLDGENEPTELTTSSANQLHLSKDLGSFEQKLISKRFIAPTDMNNTMLGLDYPKLYDEVALRLSRGRGETTRMKTNLNFLTEAKPLFKAPNEDLDEKDPKARLAQMKKFVISQRQKSENLARSRRKAEIYARNSVRWQIVDDDDQTLDKDEATA